MPGLVPGIHVFAVKKAVDGWTFAGAEAAFAHRRDHPGHDEERFDVKAQSLGRNRRL
jgi:hypothetical protein